jgi:hypothetical protein
MKSYKSYPYLLLKRLKTRHLKSVAANRKPFITQLSTTLPKRLSEESGYEPYGFGVNVDFSYYQHLLPQNPSDSIE